MVLSRRPLTPAITVPDEQTWTVAGADPAAFSVEPTFAPATARRVLVAEHVPAVLAEPAAALLSAVPSGSTRVGSRFAFAGDADPFAPPVHDHHAAAHHDHMGHEDHEGHDHHDMMAITGEPSADGLVMEPIELRFGPVGTPLPAGLAVDVSLDGDVVAECEIHALLVSADAVPDRLATKAWERASAPAGGSDGWDALAAAELERAIGHVAWLRAYGRVLGWRPLIDRATAALAALLGDHDRAAVARATAELSGFVETSRRLRRRTAGRAHVTDAQARELGLRGPAARASGVAEDARADDPLYERLGFAPVVRTDGDAWARTVVRALEAAAAAGLAARAAAAGEPAPATGQAVVEGPRGPLYVNADDEPAAPGEGAARAAAAATAIGAEWADALVGIASFDLSPWRVGK